MNFGTLCTDYVQRPAFNQCAPPFQQVRSGISTLNVTANFVGQTHLGNFTRRARDFACPVAEGRAEAVDRDAFDAHTAQKASAWPC